MQGFQEQALIQCWQKNLDEKPKLILLNKEDLADPIETDKWINYFTKKDSLALAFNSASNKNINKIIRASEKLMQERLDKNREKGINSQVINAMIV